MSHQSTVPLTASVPSVLPRSAYGIATGMDDQGGMDLSPSYQRTSVWDDDQRINLIRSMIIGLPIPAVILANRVEWKNQDENAPAFAVIDGKQRIETLQKWFTGDLFVPASWFTTDSLKTVVGEPGDQWVSYHGLSDRTRRIMKTDFKIPVSEIATTSESEEAELFLLLNSAGTAQTTDDLDRARKIAQG